MEGSVGELNAEAKPPDLWAAAHRAGRADAAGFFNELLLGARIGAESVNEINRLAGGDDRAAVARAVAAMLAHPEAQLC